MSEMAKQILGRDERFVEIQAWASTSVWTDQMLRTLHRGVERGKWYSVSDKLMRETNIMEGWVKVRSNNGKHGVDMVSVERYESELEHNNAKLLEELQDGTYEPLAVRRVEIPKGDGRKTRPLGIPAMRDRVVQTALKHVIEPIFDIDFSLYSFGFRPKLGCKDALRRVNELLKQGYLYVMDADIQSYFDMIPHDRLMDRVREKVSDGKILDLIEQFLQANIFDGLKYWESEEGTPQGGVISPLLANIYLDAYDHKMTEAGFEIVRYADDFLIMCKDRMSAKRALRKTRRWMKANGLKLHPEKTRIADMREKCEYFEFLGYHFERTRNTNQIKRWPRKQSLKKCKDTIRKKTRRSNKDSIEDIIAYLRPNLVGWYAYFKHSTVSAMRDVDKFTRRRLRSILAKYNRKKGSHRMVDNRKYNKAYFTDLGFFSLEEAWKLETQSLRSKH